MITKQLLIVLSSLLLANSTAIAGQTQVASKTEAPGVAASEPNSAVTPPAAHNSPSRDYVIGPEDVLAVNVWKEPEISRTVPVRPDGKISLPLLGDMMATGLTAQQLQASITQRLQNYVSSPEVSVIVQEVKSEKVNVVGRVVKPGSYSLSKPTTVLDAVVMAGGFRDFAKEKKIYVLRVSKDGKPDRLPFNYKEVIKGKKLSQNVVLEPHDTVVVP
jgi:polysaccharide export outer membrane protein